jgi:hypothetical protein
MHLLVIFYRQDKIHGDPSIIDKLVMAEIPEMKEGSQLKQLVKKHMVHGPCGSLHVNSPCMYKVKYDRHVCKNTFPLGLIGQNFDCIKHISNISALC